MGQEEISLSSARRRVGMREVIGPTDEPGIGGAYVLARKAGAYECYHKRAISIRTDQHQVGLRTSPLGGLYECERHAIGLDRVPVDGGLKS